MKWRVSLELWQVPAIQTASVRIELINKRTIDMVKMLRRKRLWGDKANNKPGYFRDGVLGELFTTGWVSRLLRVFWAGVG
ncbi:MAG TPA: hypothetical protein PLX35_11430 [Cyclobacteriaceae bacterium]|nr:hypothetical protein [Cyclobacteriaceae bacterium]